MSGGTTGGFIAQDSAVRSGADWLCEFALSCCPEAGAVISRKKMAREKAMARMKSQGGKFAVMIKVTLSAASSTTMLDSVSGTLPNFVAIGDRTG